MPLYTNIGGKLIEIKSLNTTTGDILKPIYGTPKENKKFHWGGFTGNSSTDQILIGTITLNCPTYVSVLLEIPDNTANTLFNTVPTDQMFVNSYGEDINTDRYDYNITYCECSHIAFGKSDATLTNKKSYLRSSSGWVLEQDYVKNTMLINPYLMNNNTNTNEYEVKVKRYSDYICYTRVKNTSYDWGWNKILYFPMDGMTADFTFSFQSLQQT